MDQYQQQSNRGGFNHRGRGRPFRGGRGGNRGARGGGGGRGGSLYGRGRGRGRGGFGGKFESINPAMLVDTRYGNAAPAINTIPMTSIDASQPANHPPTRTTNYFDRDHPQIQHHDQQGFVQDRRFFCDPCFRGYNSSIQYDLHLKNHIQCIADDCKFEGLPRVVAKHLLNFHSYSLPSGKMSEAAVERWIQARKRNFPSKDTIDEKNAVELAQIERGEILESHNEFGKFRLESKRTKFNALLEEDAGEASTSRSSGSNTRRIRPRGTTELIEKLLAEDIRHERNVILQCIRYVIKNGREFGFESSG